MALWISVGGRVQRVSGWKIFDRLGINSSVRGYLMLPVRRKYKREVHIIKGPVRDYGDYPKKAVLLGPWDETDLVLLSVLGLRVPFMTALFILDGSRSLDCIEDYWVGPVLVSGSRVDPRTTKKFFDYLLVKEPLDDHDRRVLRWNVDARVLRSEDL